MLEVVGKIMVEPPAHLSPAYEDDATGDILKAAHSFLLSSETFRWVREQNEQKGIAPMMQTTLGKYETFKSQYFTEADNQKLPKTKSGRYKWTRRWAKSWKVWKGRFKSGQLLPPEHRRDKVKSSHQLVLLLIHFKTSPPAGVGTLRPQKVV